MKILPVAITFASVILSSAGVEAKSISGAEAEKIIVEGRIIGERDGKRYQVIYQDRVYYCSVIENDVQNKVFVLCRDSD